VRDGARRAVEQARAGALRPLVLDPPATIEVEFRNAGEADHAAVVPGAGRFGDTGVRFPGPDVMTAYRGFLAGVRLAGLVG
jgi:D-aminopeptidase